MSELVSVVIPVYNGERHVGATLQSVAEQSHGRLEILVVDDGSTDGTADILSLFARQDTRIRILRQANKGVAAARNLGIRSARGDFIAPLDADDVWHPERISKQLRCLLDAPSDVGLVYSPWITIDESGAGISPCMDRDRFEGIVWLQLMLGNFLGSASTCLIKVACLRKIGLYDEEYFVQRAQGCEDWDLYLRIARRFRLLCQPDCLIAYRQVRGSMSVDVEQMMRSYERMMSKVGHPGVAFPKQVHRWSRAAYLLYLADRAALARRVGLTARLLLRVIALDPVRVLDPRVGRTLARSLLADLRSRVPAPDPAPATSSELWNEATPLSTRPIPARAIVWDSIRRGREQTIAGLQQSLAWPVPCAPDPSESAVAQP
ncbi:glycosyltransferase family 2 protein [Thiocapsa roseopersicina]|uniref:Glycosyltransferase involved in cell wall bisynthesis n=1 Tax=Thiocapsa roseopersicina TaxID=1058 RepID=A0A1H2Y3G0_THIRO|nr:glycosyltransferase family A protein [Thiocapsa roseopersicina]SDW99348.1 Glycosyltransferase involved in cell wall bisynthesis [Thiocapsa roseopersicina]